MLGDSKNFLAILDGQYPNFQGNLSFEAEHKHWKGIIDFDVGAKRARLLLNGDCATYCVVGDELIMRWDYYPAESFILQNGRFIHYPAAISHCDRKTLKVAIVTAYYKEQRGIIRRCIDSVQEQTHAADHILIADGHAQDWIDDMPVRHIRLDRAHGDYGNTPRGVGALLAIAQGYDGIGFLDADNWLEPNHVASCNAMAESQSEIDFIVARWNLRRPDETIIPFPDEPGHVDTNCFFFLEGSFHLIPHFSLMNKELSCVGDRIFFAALKSSGLKWSQLDLATVNYHCLWSGVYRALGEALPPQAKEGIDSSQVDRWLKSRTPRELEHISRRSGVKFA